MLNGKQERVLDFIRRYVASSGGSPTIAEIQQYFQINSSATVHKVLVALEGEGRITRIPNISRGIRLPQC
jgi:SOS-response transcriptional repressor LexA